jgi:hypothetical protein
MPEMFSFDEKGRPGLERELVEGFCRIHGLKLDAVVMALLDYALASKRDPALAAGTFVGPGASAALAVRPDEPRLREALNGYLQGMRQARHTLMFKYLSEEALTLIALARRE